MSSDSASPPWLEPRPSRSVPRRPFVLATCAALAAAITAELLVPAATFRTGALVSVADGSSLASLGLLKAASDTAVSKPVMSRAAESLIGTGFAVPEPGLIERTSVAFGLGAHASSREARLAANLDGVVVARPAEAPGGLEIWAEMPDAEQAAQVATAVAQGLVAEHDIAIVQARHQREVASAERLRRLAAEAAAARRRFADLGGTLADPAQVRAAAAAQVAAVQGQVDSLHAIIVSGSPPLSDGRNMPSPIQGLQNTYLDVSQQLAKAQQTLGERHTTVIALHDEVKRAAANLTAEWKRLARVAESELGAARERERAAIKAEANVGSGGRSVIADARLAVQVADERVARAEQALRDMPSEESYRLLAAAAVPTAATGFATWVRVLFVALLGLGAFWGTLMLPKLREAEAEEPADSEMESIVAPLARRPRQVDAEADRRGHVAESVVAFDEPRRAPRPTPAAPARRVARHLEDERPADMDDLLLQLRRLRPAFGVVPILLVASNEAGTGTMSAALAIGRTATVEGMRVLVVEQSGTKAALAIAADADADPIVVDVFGTLRVALPADVSNGLLYVAPSFEQGKRIASALVANRETQLVDDLADAFDLVIVDGGLASADAAATWSPDALIRVGARVSLREDDRLAASLDVSPDFVIGTFLASRFVAAATVAREDSRDEALDTPVAPNAQRPRSVRFAPPPRVTPARATPPRRKVGTR